MILTYHKIYPTSPSIWWVNIDNFYRQLCDLRSYKVVYLSDYDPKDENQVVITFDDGYENILYFAAPLLKKFSYPFEVFINGANLGKYNDFDNNVEPKAKIINVNEAKQLLAYGGRLEWHSLHHKNLELETDEKILNKELKVPKKSLQIDKKGFKWLSYPYGNFNETVKEIAKTKFKGAVSCNQGNDFDFHCLNRITATNDSSFRKHTVTVIIPSYNYGSYLIEALESVLCQTRPVEEIVIADDCSTDNTQEVSEYYLSKYPKQVKYVRNKRRLGIIKNYNQALKIVSGDYICILDADNYLVSDFIEKTAEILDSNKKVGIVYTDFALFGPRARIKYDMFPLEWRKGIKAGQYFIIKFPDLSEESKKTLKDRNFIHGNSLYRIGAAIKVGGYKKSNKFPEDQYFFYRIIEAGWLAKKASETLLGYRQHSKNQENDRFNSHAELFYYKNISKELKQELSASRDRCHNLESELNKIKSSLFWQFLYIYKNPKAGLMILLNQIRIKLFSIL